MAKRRPKAQPELRRPKNQQDGQRTYRGHGKAIVTHTVAALPILNRLIERMRLRQFLQRHLPPDDGRTKVDTPRVILLLLKNLLVSREPIYGVADCKLATTENLSEIARQGGRFITVLPATRKEDSEFRQRLHDQPESVRWQEVYRLTDDEGQLRFQLNWTLDLQQLEQATVGDGVFPLITNLGDWTACQVLQAYKRQPMTEKRFSQLKTDFRVAPVFLKSVSRIVGLLAVYFFALIVQSLLERELRNALKTQRTP